MMRGKLLPENRVFPVFMDFLSNIPKRIGLKALSCENFAVTYETPLDQGDLSS